MNICHQSDDTGRILRVVFVTILAVILVFASLVAYAVAESISWDASPRSGADGYRVVYGETSGNYSETIDAGEETCAEIPELTPGVTYYFAVIVYNSEGSESPASPEAVYYCSPPEPEPDPVAKTTIEEYVDGRWIPRVVYYATKPSGIFRLKVETL